MDRLHSRHAERQASRMSEMMQRLGVDAGKLVQLGTGEAYAAARLKCINAQECLLWLDANPPSTEEPAFCPNYDLFMSCRRGSD